MLEESSKLSDHDPQNDLECAAETSWLYGCGAVQATASGNCALEN